MFKKIITKITVLFSLLLVLNVAHASEMMGTLKIKTVDKDLKPVTGFVYEIKNTENNKKEIIDMTKSTEEVIELEYGKYIISEKTTPKEFQKASDYSFELSNKKDGVNSVEYAPKHIAEKMTPIIEEEKYTQTNTSDSKLPYIFIIGAPILIIALIVTNKKRKTA